MLNTEDKIRLSCANSYSNSCYWVKNFFSEISHAVFPLCSLLLSPGFYCDKELQELPLVHEVIFEKHID